MTDSAAASVVRHRDEKSVCDILRRKMDGFLRALGFDKQPDYAEKIPDTLSADNIFVHDTFHHGFPSQPKCLAYDPIQQLLAIGSEDGNILLLGKPGLERYLSHPKEHAITQMTFITNKGLLVSMSDHGELSLWCLADKFPSVKHTVEFSKEKPSSFSHCYGSEWLYVGTDEGNVYLIHTQTFLIATYCIPWNHTCTPGSYSKPGDVIAVLEHPMDTGKVLIAYSRGLCVVYDMKHKPEAQTPRSTKDKDRGDGHKRFTYDPGSHHILTSVCWQGNGKCFGCSYSDGTVVLWNPKIEGKPEKIFSLHESDPSAFKPIYKFQMVQTDGDPWMFFSGGFPEDNPAAPQTLTILHSRSTSLLSSSSTILDFLCLPSSPFLCDPQDPKALVILTKNELIIHDLQTPGYPRLPSASLPSVLDLHVPPVTCLHYVASCPDGFVAQLHSVKSKRFSEGKATKPWPLKGGKWGEEISQTSTDLVVTGHTDGSVRLWNCSSVIFQSFFTVGTSQHFTMQYNPCPLSPPHSAPPRPCAPPLRPPRPPLRKRDTTPPALQSINEDETEDLTMAKDVPMRRKVSIVLQGEDGSKTLIDTSGGGGAIVPSPATGQVHHANNNKSSKKEEEEETFVIVDAPDGCHSGSISPAPPSDGGGGGGGEEVMVNSREPSPVSMVTGGSPDPERKVVFPSSKKKSKLRKKSVATSTPSKEISASLKEKEKRKQYSPRLSRKSFRKMARFVKAGRQLSTEDAPDGGNAETASPSEGEDSNEHLPPPTAAPSSSSSSSSSSLQTEHPQKKRPDQIALSKPEPSPLASPGIMLTPAPEPQTPLPVSATPISAVTTPTFGGGGGNGGSPSCIRKSAKSKQSKGVRLTRVSTSAPGSVALHASDEAFFSIDTIHMCVCGLWLCVSNGGGSAMVFDFEMTEQKVSQSVEVNFDFDSVMRQSSPAPECPRVGAASVGWVFEGRGQEPLPGFQLSQHCSCFFTCDGSGCSRVPATIQTIQYSIDMGLLAVGTNRGLMVVDTRSNSCIHVLSTLTSILYLTDPVKYGKQMRKETAESIASSSGDTTTPGPPPTIKRNATSLAFSVRSLAEGRHPPHPSAAAAAASSSAFKTSASRSQSSPHIHGLLQAGTPETKFTDWDSGATVIEIVQLQLEKHAPPTLTMWVGLASGYVVAYGVRVVAGHSETEKRSSRKIEFFPTRMVVETGRSPVVGLIFLNELGDQQVVPYKRSRTLSVGRDNSLEHVGPRRQKSKREQASSAPLHYAIIVDEQKIKSYSFPGFNQVSKLAPPLSDNGVILQSSYFTCCNRPCIATVTTCRQILLHSLPGLKPLVVVPYSPLFNKRSLYSLRISGHGQGVYMSSHSELQRICVAKDDLLNLPACLPDVYAPMADCKSSFSGKGLVANLFSSTRTEIDQTKLFAESVRRPLGNLYKLDGKYGTAYSEKKRKGPAAGRPSRPGDPPSSPSSSSSPSGRQPDGVAGRMQKNVHALHERKEKLSRIEQKTAEVADHAEDFSSLAAQLARKYERR